MTMFDLVVGNTGYPTELMEIVGLTQVSRYRDHWLERDGERVDTLILAVYTRMGGGNREEYEDELEGMHDLPTFISDEDDRFDNTYCTLRFRMDKDAALRWLTEHSVSSSVTEEEVWDEMIGAAEPIPRDMAVIWDAILQANGAGADGD